jgi:hypothetical protein
LKRVFFPISAGSTLAHKDGLQQPLLDKRKADTINTDSPTTDISTSISDVSDETTTSVIMTTDESVIEVHGSDAPSTLEAVTAAAEDLGMMTLTSTGSKVQEYLKSVVYGGLDVSLISLGVVASAAGGDAKTRMHNFSILISKLLLHVSFILEEKLCMRKGV